MGERDRRAAPRHRPARDRIRIAWLEGDVLRRAVARLVDLSRGGAAIVLDGPLPPRGPVWVGLEGTPHSEWMLADVVRAAPLAGAAWGAGLRFVRPCAFRFFSGAIWGATPGDDDAVAGELRQHEPAACSCCSTRPS